MSAMNRRDLLKLIGIGAVGAVATVVGGTEAEAAPVAEVPKHVEPSLQDTLGYLNALYGGDTVYIGSASFYPMGTALFMPTMGTGPYWGEPAYKEYAERHGLCPDPYDFGGDE